MKRHGLGRIVDLGMTVALLLQGYCQGERSSRAIGKRRVRKTIPPWAPIASADQVIPPAEQTLIAERAGAHITYVNAGHLSLIPDPETVAQVIEQAACATS